MAATSKLFKNLFRLLAIFLPNLRILLRKNNAPTLFIPFRAMTVIKRQLSRRLKEHQKAFFFGKKENFSFVGAHMPN